MITEDLKELKLLTYNINKPKSINLNLNEYNLDYISPDNDVFGNLYVNPEIKRSDANINSSSSVDNLDLNILELSPIIRNEPVKLNLELKSELKSDIPINITEVKTRGKTSGKSVSQPVLRGLLDLFEEEGINVNVTSWMRENNLFKSGNKSHHIQGNAMDITPGDDETWDTLRKKVKSNKRLYDYFKKNNIGILDETNSDTLKKTGGTGAHWHIGPDKIALSGLDSILLKSGGILKYQHGGLKYVALSDNTRVHREPNKTENHILINSNLGTLHDLGGKPSKDNRTHAQRNSDYWHPIKGAIARWNASVDSSTNPINALVSPTTSDGNINPGAILTLGVTGAATGVAKLASVIAGASAASVGVDLIVKSNSEHSGWGDMAESFGIPKIISDFTNPGGLIGGGGTLAVSKMISRNRGNRISSLIYNRIKSLKKSEINWKDWNEEIPLNTKLMEEYANIEKSAKRNGTWMKDKSGNPYNGTPELFVQEQSTNFKKAFPDGYDEVFRGSRFHISDFTKRNRNDFATFYHSNPKSAETYTDIHTIYNPSKLPKGYNEVSGEGMYNVLIPKVKNDIVVDAGGKNWRLLNPDKRLSNNEKFINGNMSTLLYLQNTNSTPKHYIPGKKYLNTDAYAEHIMDHGLPKATINNVIDNYGSDAISNVHIVNPNKLNVKSRWYNNGEFDMKNSNIYKTLIPFLFIDKITKSEGD